MKRFFFLTPLTRWILFIGLVFLILMTVLRLVLYFYFNHQGYSLLSVSDALVLGARFDLRVISLLLLILLIAGSIPALYPFRSLKNKKIWMVVLTIVSSFLVFLYFIDFAHYSYLSKRLNASVLNFLEDARISMNMVWQSYPVIKIVAGMIIVTAVLVLLISRQYHRIKKHLHPVSGKTRIANFIVFFLIFGLLVFGRIGQYPLRWSDAYGLGSDYKANIALNPFESFFNTLKFRGNSFDEKKLVQLYPVVADYLGITSTARTPLNFERIIPQPDSPVNQPNVIVVICESFSAYKSSMWGNPMNTTPFFNSLCKNGLFFDRCFTPTFGTARGVWAVITGTPDVESPATASRNPAAVDQHTIMNDFMGYEKYYFLGGSTSWANVRGLLVNNIKGLHLYEQDNFDAPKVDVWGISDKNLFLGANKILGQEDKPFFAVIQTADNHRSFTIPAEDLVDFKVLTSAGDSLKKYGFESLAEYNAFRYTDYCFKKFIEVAQKEKYFTNTIFAFVGDHGVPGNAGKLFPSVWTEKLLTEHHVPLLFYSPKLIRPERINNVCSQIDVLPTIAGLCKIGYRNNSIGRDLLDSSARKKFAFLFDLEKSQISIINDEFLYQKHINSPAEELISILNEQQVSANEPKDTLRLLSEGIYEASRYLLLNNKKR